MLRTWLAALSLFLATLPAAAAGRLALVIGESRYASVPALANPANDAADLAQSLRGLGFEVILRTDAGRDAIAGAVRDFSDKIAGADLAVFFYAGHGVQMNGENYLVPVDAKIASVADVRFNTINLADVAHGMDAAKGAKIVILDACRNNPFVETLKATGRALATRGLARMDASGEGTLIVYSTQPDNVALDGAGRNSPFTESLIKRIAAPGVEVRQMISRVRGDVLAATDRKQTPWDSSSLVGDVYLAGDGPAAPAPAAIVAQAPEPQTNATPRQAAPSAENECDAIAGLRIEHLSPTQVHETAATDWVRGVAVCGAEVAAHPGEAHYLYQLARAQDHTRDYIEALRNYKTVAAAGFSEADYDIGAMYYYGRGVVQSYSTAIEHIARAADAGSIRALGGLAGMYGDGRGVPKDDAKSLDYAEKAVEAGNPFGLKVIADHYYNGAGVPRDYAMAAQYLQQAADLGDGQSMKFLANLYEGGYLGAADAAKAGELRLRAQQVDPGSKDPIPAHLPPLRANYTPVPHRVYGGSGGGGGYVRPHRRYVVYHYNPVWQAAPGDTRCCPNNMLVCPLGRHFCGH